ncbi:type II toxin-antitoxin system prevent-host-death family antitoxin, partial [Streptococcus pneumoniae]
NKNPDEDIVVLSKSEWDSIQETLRIAQNKELSDKVLRGMDKIRAGH